MNQKCSHRWFVYSTGISLGCIMVKCAKCPAEGLVYGWTIKEWQKAYDAPSNPYEWFDNDRVTVDLYTLHKRNDNKATINQINKSKV